MIPNGRSRNACSSCRQRKTKCGKELPSCSQCVNAGWHCPGYSGRWRFRNGGARPERMGNADNKCFSRSGTHIGQYSIFKIVKSNNTLVPSIPRNLEDSLRARFIAQISQTENTALSFFAPSAPYLSYLPPRIGNSTVLDNAIECICFSCVPRPQGSLPRTKYLKALRSLQEGLQDEKTSMATETLAAVMLLQMFEQFTDTDSLTWVKHAGGAIRLIELRGPQSLQSYLERAILDSQIVRINFECIREERSSFLAEPEWQSVFERPDESNATRFSHVKASSLKYYQILSLFPGILKQYLAWQQTMLESLGNSSTLECSDLPCAEKGADFTKSSLHQGVLSFRDLLRAWRIEHAAQLFWASESTYLTAQSLLLPIPSTSNIPTRQVLAMECHSSIFLVIANHMLVQLRYGRSLCFQSICKAADTDFEVHRIRDECVYYAKVFNKADSFFRASYPTAAFLLRDGLATAWRKATRLHYQGKHSCNDLILQAVGCLL